MILIVYLMYYILHYTVETTKGSSLAPVVKIDLGIKITEMTVAKAKRDDDGMNPMLTEAIEEAIKSGDDKELMAHIADFACFDYIAERVGAENLHASMVDSRTEDETEEAATEGKLVVDDKKKEIQIWELRYEERAK